MTRVELLQIAKPVLFNTEMVKAILEGRKTVTRRLVKSKQLIGVRPDKCPNGLPEEFIKEKPMLFLPYCNMTDSELVGAIYKSPCNVGDILYVRETWYKDLKRIMYKANYSENEKFYQNGEEILMKWKPSIHMPKEVARIFLKVKDVRVERLQDITEEQAKAEGIREYSKDGKLWKYAVTDEWWIEYHRKNRKQFVGSWWQDMPRTAKEAFHHLWNSTLGRKDTPEWYANNWSGNPWVWVYEFERIEPNVEQ